MQQNVRAAKMFVERDVRMAGSGVANLHGPNDDTSTDPPILPLLFENNVGTTGTDQLSIIYDNPNGNPCGELKSPATTLCSDLPPLTLSGNMMPASAATANVAEDAATIDLWDAKNCSCNGIVYGPGKPIPLIVTSPDKSHSTILVASNFNGSSQKILNNKINDGTSIPGYQKFYDYLGEPTTNAIENKVLNTFPEGSTISFFSSPKIIYFVDTDGNGISSLYRDTGSGGKVLAEHIEDFQCSFELFDEATSLTSNVFDRNLTDAEIPQVRLVTINVLGRSAHPHVQGGAFAGQREQLEDHLAGAADNFRRRLLTVTVKVRNFELN